jgi:hypothetical protein
MVIKMPNRKISFSEAIEQIMLHNGYLASLQHIYREFHKYRALTGKTPFNTIQERVQRDKRFTRIGLGLYALTKFLDKIQKEEEPRKEKEKVEYQHARIQGMLLEIGELQQYETYTYDKNKTFDGKPLGLIMSIKECPEFTYPNIIQQSVKFIDVIWFNERKFPFSVYEVENSTDFRSALIKFFELQDFTTKFFVVSPEERRQKFYKEIEKRAFVPIANRCNFKSYDDIERYYQALLNYSKVKDLL